MIAEWLTSLRMPYPRHIRAVGFHKELVALAYRYDRQQAHWQPHLQQTRDVIAAAMDRCPAKRTALVLGAGGLLDVPLARLCEQFARVHLVDVVFLPGTRRAAKRFDNCNLITCDITGTLEPVFDLDSFAALPRPVDPAALSGIVPSLTLSVNMLSQLPLMPLDHLERRSNGQLNEDEPPLSRFCHDVVAHHLAWLKSLPGQVCLISDERRFLYRYDASMAEQSVGEEDALFGNALPPGGEQWMWDIAPPGEQEKHLGIRHLVRGYADF